MKKYPEFKETGQRSEFFKFCGSLTILESQKWDIEDLSIRLNASYPQSALHESPAKIQWQAARDNLDRILQPNKGVIYQLASQHPITSIIIGVIIGIIVTFVGVFYIEPLYKSLQPTKSETQTPLSINSSSNVPSE